MLIVRVMQPVSAAGLLARFDARGGSIGRAPDCTLALPDPHKHVSRVQSEIRWTGSGWVLVNVSEVNAIVVNGLEVPPRGSSRLAHGDRIAVADFLMGVEELPEATASADPFAALLPGSSAVPPVAPSQPASAPAVAPWPDDIFSGLEGFAAAPPDVPAPPAQGPTGGQRAPAPPAQADPWRAGPASSPTAGPWPLEVGAGPGGGAADPLGIEGFPRSPSSPIGGPTSAAGAPQAGGDPSIDDLFGLAAGPPPLDPLAPVRSDPGLDAGGRVRIASDASMSDHLPELNAAMRLPAFAPGPTPARPAVPPPKGDARQEAASFRSWEAPDAVPRTTIVAGGRAPGPAPLPEVREGARPRRPAAPQPSGASRPPETPRTPSIQGAPAAAPPGASAGVPRSPVVPPPTAADPESPDAIVERVAQAYPRSFETPPVTRPTELLDGLNQAALAATPHRTDSRASGPSLQPADPVFAALLRGAGLAELPRAADEAGQVAAAHRAGEVLALAVSGMVGLLAARARFKHELRAQVTTIAARENNPLKFSPDAAGALAHLLSPGAARGFMDGPAATRDAFDDLLAHQIAMVAGMRAAMQTLAARFDPAALERRLEKRASLLDSMLPMARKARLWEVFSELYDEIARDAREDFEQLFSTEFVKAYEAQLDRLDRDADAGARPGGGTP